MMGIRDESGGARPGTMSEEHGGRAARRSWLLAAGLRATSLRLRAAWRAQPARARRRWLATLAIGLVAAWALCALVTLVVRSAGAGLDAWDEALLRDVLAGPWSLATAILLETPGNFLFLVPLLLAAAVVAIHRGRPLLALSFPIGYAAARLAVAVGYLLWDRARPTLAAVDASPGLRGFPSGHSAYSLVVWGLLAWLWARSTESRVERALAIALGAAVPLLVGYARLRMCAHWPSDVLAGWLVGAAVLLTLVVALRRAESAGGR